MLVHLEIKLLFLDQTQTLFHIIAHEYYDSLGSYVDMYLSN